jgi:hypothetical protein
MTALA